MDTKELRAAKFELEAEIMRVTNNLISEFKNETTNSVWY